MPTVHRSNILFCVFDALGSDLSRLLEPTSALPALTELGRRARLFEHVYAPCPEGSPARASLFTGLDPCVHGVWTDGVELPAHEQTLPGILAQAGYTTWLAGRWQMGGVSHWTTERIRPGQFTETAWAHGPLHRSRQNAWLNWLGEQAPETLAQLFDAGADPDDTRASERQHQTLESLPDALSFNHWVGERISTWIDATPANEAFLAVAGFSVEASMGAEPRHSGTGELTNPVALRQADAAIGHLLERLDATGRREDTVVVVTAARGSRSPQREADAMSEASIKVPLLLHVPGTPAHRHSSLQSTLDIAPTLVEVAGLPARARMQGHSLLQQAAEEPPHPGETPPGWALCRLRREPDAEGRDWQTTLRLGALKLVMQHADATRGRAAAFRLYNLDTDPDEASNLADDPRHASELDLMIDTMIDARCAREDRTEPRIAEF